MRSILRSLVKRPLNLLGLDLVRYHPRYSMGEYAYVSSFGIKTVIDAGAHSGEFAQMITRMMPEAAIYSFEPLADVFQDLQKAMKGVPDFRAFNCALGDHDETTEIYRSNSS